MAEVIKRLGTTVATSAASLYESSGTASTYTIISKIVIANTSATSYTYTISTSAASSTTHGAYIVYGATIAGNDSVFLGEGVCLDPTNRWLVGHSSNAAVVITAYGLTGP